MRNLFLVTYDISDPKRWQRVHRTMKGFGEPLQYSVFACELSASQRVRLQTALEELIDPGVDRTMIVNLGPAQGAAKDRVVFMGREAAIPERGVTIV